MLFTHQISCHALYTHSKVQSNNDPVQASDSLLQKTIFANTILSGAKGEFAAVILQFLFTTKLKAQKFATNTKSLCTYSNEIGSQCKNYLIPNICRWKITKSKSFNFKVSTCHLDHASSKTFVANLSPSKACTYTQRNTPSAQHLAEKPLTHGVILAFNAGGCPGMALAVAITVTHCRQDKKKG